ncbi:MAG TPA: response regulator transcription factor [Anaerolineales bacterium]|nr:response regulator transcription factor [Anaerolineales bacterium]HNE05095.1 response regulator transcription factor [Anaerolineales bacterium]HNH26765.1 response regulator transcription factor [Anaerolineales bacterium]
MIRVTIVSPNHALRVGLREMLANQAGIRVVGEATRLSDVNERETEVAVLASVSSVRSVDQKDFCILFLTDDIESVRPLLSSGMSAWGVLSSEANADELAAGIAAVAEGLWVGAPGLVEGLMRLPKGGEGMGEESLPEPLTAREKEVLQHMAEGLANKQIALALRISEHTVKFHLSALYAKLGAASRTEAVKRGIELGLISL